MTAEPIDAYLKILTLMSDPRFQECIQNMADTRDKMAFEILTRGRVEVNEVNHGEA